MIYFISSKPNQQKTIEEMLHLLQIGATIRFLDETTGIIDFNRIHSQSLNLLTQHLRTEGPFTLTMLESIDYDKISLESLKFQHSHNPGSYYTLAELFVIVINQDHKELLNHFVKFYQSLPTNNLEIIIEYTRNGGSIQQTALNLYVHRNTVTNKIQQFEHQTNLNLRDTNQLLLLRLIYIYYSNVHDAQEL